jgi:hypothetical protein
MSDPVQRRQPLSYSTEADAVADVRRLRSGYRKAGNWSLPQASRHLAAAIERTLAGPDPTVPPAPVDPAAIGFFRSVLSTGQIPSGRPTAAAPPADCDDRDVDRLLAALDQLAALDHPVETARFGTISAADARRFHRIHAAHHLSHLVPTV